MDLLLYFLIADFLSGVFHWAEDTYGEPGVLGGIFDQSIILPNIDHHKQPFKMVQGTYWETNRVSIQVAAAIILLLVLVGVTDWKILLMVALGSHLNQVHKWAHDPQAPIVVQKLQTLGILQSVKHHAEHHQKPYDSRYCILSNILNPILDKVHFWRHLEWLLDKAGLKVVRNSVLRDGY